MKYIIGEKIGMSQVFDEKGMVVPVTIIKAGPCFVLQLKTKKRDSYNAVQVGFKKKEKNIKKTEKTKEYKHIREFRAEEEQLKKIKKGDKIDISIFKEGDSVKISGTSKAKGFQGVVKRWGFKGASKTHGTKHTLRKGGSIGATDPAKVFKGKKMAGRTGGQRITLPNVKIVKIEKENNLIFIKGAVPGRRGTILEIKG